MRVIFNPEDEAFWQSYYLSQATQTGHGLSAFQGVPYQRGNGLGSLFRSLFRLIVPVGKSAAKAIGRQALASGAEIASDLVQGRSFKESVKDRGKKGVGKLAKKFSNKLQTGQGLGKRKASTSAGPAAKRQKEGIIY